MPVSQDQHLHRDESDTEEKSVGGESKDPEVATHPTSRRSRLGLRSRPRLITSPIGMATNVGKHGRTCTVRGKFVVAQRPTGEVATAEWDLRRFATPFTDANPLDVLVAQRIDRWICLACCIADSPRIQHAAPMHTPYAPIDVIGQDHIQLDSLPLVSEGPQRRIACS